MSEATDASAPAVLQQHGSIDIPDWSADDIEGFVRATKLCGQCVRLFDSSRSPPDSKFLIHPRTGYDQHASYDGLLRSVAAGCRICAILKTEWDRQNLVSEVAVNERLPAAERPSRNDMSLSVDKQRNWIKYHLQFKHTATGVPWYEASLPWLIAFQVDFFRRLIVPNPTSRGNTVTASLSTLHRWMKACNGDGHARCQRYKNELGRNLYRPTRLLYLDPRRPGTVRLVSGDGTEQGPYVTLSHRWGNPEPPKLSERQSDGRISTKQLREGILASSLPRAFQDAVCITRHCGIEYLWIDSLCILQDKDAEDRNADWEREAPKVGSIYSGGVFNIAATHGQNSEGSLFPEEQPMLVPFVQCPGPKKSRDDYDPVMIISQHFGDEFDRDVMSSELLQRGWVYQEVLLAPANLFCTTEQMWWSCSDKSCSQIRPNGCPIDGRSSAQTELDVLAKRKLAITAQGSHTDPIGPWAGVLEHYARTTVTFKNDRLVAISGIANVFRSLFPKQLGSAGYHSGVWSTDVLNQLCWTSRTKIWKNAKWRAAPRHRFQTDHYMPSWSPASSNILAEYSSGMMPSYTLPVECFMDTSGLDQFGRATTQEKGTLHIRGVLTKMAIGENDRIDRGMGHAWPFGYERGALMVFWDSLEEASLAEAPASTNTFAALLIKCDAFDLQGLLLRAVPDPDGSGGGRAGKWLRCGYLRSRGWPPTKGETWEERCRNVVQAFHLDRYGISWRPARAEDNAGKRAWVQDRTDAPPDLEDIFIV